MIGPDFAVCLIAGVVPSFGQGKGTGHISEFDYDMLGVEMLVSTVTGMLGGFSFQSSVPILCAALPKELPALQLLPSLQLGGGWMDVCGTQSI